MIDDHLMTDDNMCKECSEVFNNAEQVRRHLRKHLMTAQEYSLKWDHGNIIPKCACGCDKETSWNVASKAYTQFVHGHHAWGRKKSEEEKRKIGEKNRANMKRYMQEHPEIAKQRQELMTRAGMNSVTSEKKARAMSCFWSSDSELTHQRRKEASDRAIVQLELGQIGPHAPFRVEMKHNPFTGKEERMHSSWESAFLDDCIKHGAPVTKDHDLRVPYVGTDGSHHQYVPDFVDLEDGTVVEVKGYLSETDVIKLNALVEWAKREKKRVVLWRPDGWETLWSPELNFRWKGPLVHEGSTD